MSSTEHFRVSLTSSALDLNMDGIYEPTDGVNPGDTVVDMGLRGLFPTWQ